MAKMRLLPNPTYCLASPSGTPPLLPIPLPTSSPPFLLPSTDCRADVPKDGIIGMSGQLNLLRRDRRSHARTTRLMESEAKVAREAWSQLMDASDMARSGVRALQTTVLAQQTKIRDLRAADHR
ncbi:hypothetical protein Tco_0108739 [Tanacetum coccineum]